MDRERHEGRACRVLHGKVVLLWIADRVYFPDVNKEMPYARQLVNDERIRTILH